MLKRKLRMTNQLTNEERARVFAMYWGCETTSGGPYANVNPIILDIAKRGKLACQLRLTPLSSITDEHAIEVVRIVYPSAFDGLTEVVRTLTYNNFITIWLKYPSLDFPERFEESSVSVELLNNVPVYEHLKLRGYAVPLFFGINHWANGKTAIELEIAIDRTNRQQECAGCGRNVNSCVCP